MLGYSGCDCHNLTISGENIVVSTIATPVSSRKLSDSHIISTGSSAGVFRLNRKRCIEDDSSLN